MRVARAVLSWALVSALSALALASPAAGQEGEVDLSVHLGGFALDTTAAGARRTLDLSVSNVGGPVGATGVEVQLEMPPGAQVLPTPASDCASGSGTVTCLLGDIGPSSGRSQYVPVLFDEAGPVEVTATVSADQSDSDATDNVAVLSFVVVEELADLAVVDRRERALTGTTHTVSHVIWNHGPTHAGGASITGSFPAGVEVVPGSLVVHQGLRDVAGGCTVSEIGFTCDSLFDLEPGTGNEVSYALVMPDEPATLESSITVSGRNDPDPSDDTGTVTLDVGVAVAELRTDLILFGPLLAGEPSPATVWTWNSGDGAAADVATTIEAPAGWAFSPPSGSDPGRTCAVAPGATSVTCTYESIAPNTRRDIELLLTPPTGSGTGTVTVEAETPTPESGTLPNTDAKTVRYAPAGIDIVAVSADHDPDTPRARAPELSTITWRFRNATPERLSDGIVFSVQVPNGAEAIFMETRAFEPGGSAGSDCDVEGDPEPSCPLDMYEVDEIEVTLFVFYDTAGSYTFTATAESDGEQSPGDESLAHTVEVEASSTDLTMGTVTGSAEVTVGEVLTYTAFVTNGGPQPTTGVEVTDRLPAGVEIVSATTGWFGQPCIINDDGYVCRPGWSGYLAPGDTAFVNVAVRPTAAGSVTIEPTVIGLQEDPDMSSNTDPVPVDVVEPGSESPVDLHLSWQDRGAFVAGALVPVVALVEVPAGRAATDVELNVSGADNLEIVSSAQGWFSSPCASPTSCTIPTVSAGSFGFVVLHVRPLAPGPFSVDVNAAAAQPDPDPSDNAVTVQGEAS